MIDFIDFKRRDERRIDSLLQSLEGTFLAIRDYPSLYPEQTAIAASVSLVALQYLRLIEIREIPFDDRAPELLYYEEKAFRVTMRGLLEELEAFRAELAPRL